MKRGHKQFTLGSLMIAIAILAVALAIPRPPFDWAIRSLMSGGFLLFTILIGRRLDRRLRSRSRRRRLVGRMP